MSQASKGSSIAAEIAARLSALPDVTLVTLRGLRRQVSRELAGQGPELVIAVALRLVAKSTVPRWFAYEIVCHNTDAIATLTLLEAEQLGNGISSWDQVDAFACYVSGPAWRDGQLNTADIERWSASGDRWWRRAALVSTVPLNNTARGGRGDAERTLIVCDLLKHDRDDMVVKAMSWALRELAKKEPRIVEAYVSRHETELMPRVLREVRNKLVTGLKNPKSLRPR
jgi:3-methyladenine DNA glycosylase AlkD